MMRFVEFTLDSGCVLSINVESIASVLKRPDGSVAILYYDGLEGPVEVTDSYESVMDRINNVVSSCDDGVTFNGIRVGTLEIL